MLAKVYIKLNIIIKLYFILSIQEKYTISIEFYIRNTDKVSYQNHLLNNNNKSKNLGYGLLKIKERLRVNIGVTILHQGVSLLHFYY